MTRSIRKFFFAAGFSVAVAAAVFYGSTESKGFEKLNTPEGRAAQRRAETILEFLAANHYAEAGSISN